jgi:hypothetical protein
MLERCLADSQLLYDLEHQQCKHRRKCSKRNQKVVSSLDSTSLTPALVKKQIQLTLALANSQPTPTLGDTQLRRLFDRKTSRPALADTQPSKALVETQAPDFSQSKLGSKRVGVEGGEGEEGERKRQRSVSEDWEMVQEKEETLKVMQAKMERLTSMSFTVGALQEQWLVMQKQMRDDEEEEEEEESLHKQQEGGASWCERDSNALCERERGIWESLESFKRFVQITIVLLTAARHSTL